MSASNACSLKYCHLSFGRATGAGDDRYGGAIYCNNSSPVISNSLIYNCRALQGGGIYCANSAPMITNNTIKQDSALTWPDGAGGGIFLYNSNPIISHNLITENVVDGCGGGINYVYNSNPTISDNQIVNNKANGWGGGIYMESNCGGTISNNNISQNELTANWLWQADKAGGGIAIRWNSHPTIVNNLINSNVMNGGWTCYGGGIAVWENSSPIITNNDFIANTAESGGGIHGTAGTSALVKNCIVWGNNPNGLTGTFAWVMYSCIQGGYTGAGNINSDPLFTQGYHLSQIAAGQTQNSPCVNAGDPISPMIIGTTRTDSIQDSGIVDMGYHYPIFGPPPQPPLSITLIPVNPPIIIPGTGGSFDFTVTLENNTDSSQTFDAWTIIQTPQMVFVPSFGPYTLTLPASVNLTRTRIQNVPGYAPPGTYFYWGYVGDYPWVAVNSDSFIFSKMGSSDLGFPDGDWSCTGDPFPGEEAASHHPSTFNLSGAYPNPFNPSTTLSYELRAASYVSLKVYDTSGRLVSTLVDGWRQAGDHEVTFDGSRLASGLYFVKMQAGEFTAVQKMVLLK